MKKPLLAALAAITLLSGCASVRESRVNPFNWFGSAEVEKDLAPESGEFDGRPLVNQVVSMKIDRAPGGAIVTAIGLPPTQGYWEAELVAENDGYAEDGVLTYQFRIWPPAYVSAQGTQQSRELSAGIFVSDQSLQGVSRIVVLGAQNSMSSRR